MLDPKEVARVTAERSDFHEKKDSEIRKMKMEKMLEKRKKLKSDKQKLSAKSGRKRAQLKKYKTNKNQGIS